MVNSVKDLYVNINPFYFIGSNQHYQKFKDFIKYVERAVVQVSLANYLGMRFTFKTINDFTESQPIMEENETVFQSIKKAIDKINGRFKDTKHREYDYKFVDQTGKIYSINGISDNENHRIIFQLFDPISQVVDNSFFEMNDSQITRMASLVYSKNEHLAIKYIEKKMKWDPNEPGYNPDYYDKREFLMIANCLVYIAEMPLNSDFEYQIHTPFELSFIRKLISMNPDQFPIIKVPILTSKELDKNIILEKFSYSFSYTLNQSLNDFFEGLKEIYDCVPLLELTDKELLQMHRYACKKIKKENSVNLNEILKDPKYGKTFRWNLDADGVKEGDILFTIIQDPDSDAIIIQILYTIDKKYDFLFHINIVNGNEFKGMNNNLEGIDLFIYIKDTNNGMLSSITDFQNIIPKYFEKAKDIIGFGLVILSFFIMVADNPVKFGTARKIYHKTEKVIKNKRPVEEKKEIIKHIIAFKSLLKEKVKEQKNDLSIKREVDYVLENWERAGHYRNYKSGKQVWISKTNCHRHLDLTTKKIKIKM